MRNTTSNRAIKFESYGDEADYESPRNTDLISKKSKQQRVGKKSLLAWTDCF